MRQRTLLAGLLLATLGASSATAQEHPAHWGYSGEAGPEHWGELDDDFETCSAGRNQSPVDLDNLIEAELPAIPFDYQPGGHQVVNNGHVVQVDYSAGSRITVDATAFELKQFHFHAPSENTIDGKSFPLEAHFVHADAQGNLAVVALMFEQGGSNKLLEALWRQVPSAEGGETHLAVPVAAADLLPSDRNYYRYSGSLTTPPCTEGVRWLVLKQPAQATVGQLGKVRQVIGHANNRPVQPTGARPLLK